MAVEKVFGRSILSVYTLPKRSVTLISNVESGADAVTLNKWADSVVVNAPVGWAPTFNLLAS